MSTDHDGGYEAGYKRVPCFWGTEPGSLVRALLGSQIVKGLRALDVGAGEGKNANALAAAGALVDAVECSASAIQNGRRAFPDTAVNWICGDISLIELPNEQYDVIVSYGLAHCLPNVGAAESLILRTQAALRPGGAYILVSFNDGPHDLSAHAGFAPLLLPHGWFVSAFEGWELIVCTDTLLFETHPHNGIPHHHSLTRIWARKPQ